MRDTTKEFLGDLLISHFSNARAVSAAKTRHLLFAIIFFVIGNFLPIIPLMVRAGTSYGASFLSGNTYGLEISMSEQTHSISENYAFKVNDENQLLAYDKSGSLLQRTAEQEEQPLVPHYVNQNTNQIDLEVYYLDRKETSKDKNEETIKSFVTMLEDRTYKSGTTELYTKQDKNDTTVVYKPSYIILYPQGIVMAVYAENSTTVAASSYGGSDWKRFEKNVDIIGSLSNVFNENGSELDYDLRNSTYTEGVLNNWKKTFNLTYENRKILNFWATSGIYYGIYLGLTVFMGLLIFLLTRGKKNPYNYLSILTCEKIEAWICFAPAILGMIVGFIFANFAVMAYIMLLGLRTMWLTMKQLRPQY